MDVDGVHGTLLRESELRRLNNNSPFRADDEIEGECIVYRPKAAAATTPLVEIKLAPMEEPEEEKGPKTLAAEYGTVPRRLPCLSRIDVSILFSATSRACSGACICTWRASVPITITATLAAAHRPPLRSLRQVRVWPVPSLEPGRALVSIGRNVAQPQAACPGTLPGGAENRARP